MEKYIYIFIQELTSDERPSNIPEMQEISMIGFRKKKKKKQSNKIRRSITVKSPVNSIKLLEVKNFLISYNQCVNYFIKKYWNRKDIVKDKFIGTHSVQSAKQHFPTLKSRVVQCAGKEALQNIRSQSEKSIRQRKIPRFKKLSATLDSRFWKFSKNPNSFEWIQFESGPTFGLPFKRNEKYWNKWSSKEFKLSKTIRVKIHDNNIFIEFFFEKKKTQLKSEGETLGIDLGYRKILATSNNQIIGELKRDVENLDKRENNTHEMIENKILHELKKLDLANIKTLVLEDLNITRKRGRFSRRSNRLLSYWHYAKVVKWLEQRCEEIGICITYVNPWKTSQFCRFCCKYDRRNRKGDKFKCIHCGHEDDADFNGAKNLKLLGLAGVHSLRLLKKEVCKSLLQESKDLWL